jgi:hypothetical protein
VKSKVGLSAQQQLCLPEANHTSWHSHNKVLFFAAAAPLQYAAVLEE